MRFALVDISGSGGSTVYTAPSGFVYVLRNVSISNEYGSTQAVAFGINGLAGKVLYEDLATSMVASWLGHQVFEPTDTLEAYSDHGSIRVWASGYQLTI